MRHLGLIYGQANQSLPRQSNPLNLELKAMVKLNCDINILRLSRFGINWKKSGFGSHYTYIHHFGVIHEQASLTA